MQERTPRRGVVYVIRPRKCFPSGKHPKICLPQGFSGDHVLDGFL
jgi:hypothetical protein